MAAATREQGEESNDEDEEIEHQLNCSIHPFALGDINLQFAHIVDRVETEHDDHDNWLDDEVEVEIIYR